MKDRIRQIMEREGLTQQEFAAKLSLAPANVSSIFTGRTNPTNKHVQAIHHAFPDININWLMFGEGEMCSTAPSDHSLVRGIEAASHEVGGVLVSPLDAAVQSPATPAATDAGAEVAGPLPSLFGQSVPTGRVVPSVGSAPGRSGAQGGGSSLLSAGLTPAALAALTAAAEPPSPRRVKEIRVFYDDGTYETFSPAVSK